NGENPTMASNLADDKKIPRRATANRIDAEANNQRPQEHKGKANRHSDAARRFPRISIPDRQAAFVNASFCKSFRTAACAEARSIPFSTSSPVFALKPLMKFPLK